MKHIHLSGVEGSRGKRERDLKGKTVSVAFRLQHWKMVIRHCPVVNSVLKSKFLLKEHGFMHKIKPHLKDLH